MKPRPLTIKDIVPMGDYNTCDILSAVEWLKKTLEEAGLNPNEFGCEIYYKIIDEAFNIK